MENKRNAEVLHIDERIQVDVLAGLSGWGEGKTINGLLESMHLSNYRFNERASEEEIKQVKKALKSLIKKEQVVEDGLGYKITQSGADYLRTFSYISYGNAMGDQEQINTKTKFEEHFEIINPKNMVTFIELYRKGKLYALDTRDNSDFLLKSEHQGELLSMMGSTDFLFGKEK
jgi:hypothetical protein